MSDIDHLLSKSNDRWAAAARRAHDVADLGLSRALRTYYALYFPASLVVLVAAEAGLDAWVFGGGPADRKTFWMVGSLLAAFACLIGAPLYSAKKLAPAAKVGKIDVLVSLEEGERIYIRRQILGKAPVDPGHLLVSRAAAVQLRRKVATQLLWSPVLPLAFIPQVIRGAGIISWLMAASMILWVMGGMLTFRDFQRAGSFLVRTAEPGPLDVDR